ncbi:MAG: hypothetical protein AB1599_09225 [Planctomycetota bacterium]
MMNKMIRTMIVLAGIVAIMGCDYGERIAQLQKDVDSYKQELAKKDAEIAANKEDAEKAKAQLDLANKDLAAALEKNSQMASKVAEVENKLQNVADALGKEGLIMPACLIGRSVVIYTKPYADTQVIIGTVQKIQQGDKITLDLSESGKTIEVPVANIIGYRLLK